MLYKSVFTIEFVSMPLPKFIPISVLCLYSYLNFFIIEYVCISICSFSISRECENGGWQSTRLTRATCPSCSSCPTFHLPDLPHLPHPACVDIHTSIRNYVRSGLLFLCLHVFLCLWTYVHVIGHFCIEMYCICAFACCICINMPICI